VRVNGRGRRQQAAEEPGSGQTRRRQAASPAAAAEGGFPRQEGHRVHLLERRSVARALLHHRVAARTAAGAASAAAAAVAAAVAAGVPARLAGCAGFHAHRCAKHDVLVHVNMRLWELFFSSSLWLLGLRI
jgi:hypothetical protein